MIKEIDINNLYSKDGTKIVYDQLGEGPAVVLVDGAMCTRSSGSKPELVKVLASHFTVYSYDRRGRGESGDTLPYAVAREIEDIEALIDAAGGSAYLYGHSSGASLALDAAAKLGNKVKKLAMYEAPYNDDPDAQKLWGEYIKQLTILLQAGQKGDAVALFMQYVGTPPEHIEGMRHAPFWSGMEALGSTLAYDHTFILGHTGKIPTELATNVKIPTLTLNGEKSFPFMYETALALSKVIPNAQHRVLEGQTHNVNPDVLAPVLQEFFTE